MILTPSQMVTSGHMRTYDDTKRICIKYLTNYTLSSNFISELGNFAVDVYDTLSCKVITKYCTYNALLCVQVCPCMYICVL